MLRKKNYKDQDHFTQYYSAVIPKHNGAKLTLYYKRHRPAQKIEQSLYNAVHRTSTTPPTTAYPVDRTLEAISFDGKLDNTKDLFRKIGKIRKFITGESQYSGKHIHYCIVIFKYEYDLVKCFADEYLQTIANQLTQKARPNEEEIEEQRRELIATHLGPELEQATKLQQLYEEGFNPITNKFGQFKVDYAANQKMIEQLPQTKRKKKQLGKQKQQRQEEEQAHE